jgi:hypothetical protein
VSVFAAEMLGRIGLEPTLGVLLLALVGTMVAKGAFLWMSVRQQGYAVANIATDLRLMLIRAFLKARWSFFISQRAGHLSNSIGSEAHRASMAYAAACGLLAGVVQVVVYLVVAFPGFTGRRRGGAGDRHPPGPGAERPGGRGQGRRATADHADQVPLGTAHRRHVRHQAHQGHGPRIPLQPLLEAETRELNEAQRRQVLAAGVLSSFKEPLLVIVIALGLFVVMTRGAVSFESLLVMVFLFHRLVGNVQGLQGRYQDLSISESAFWSLLDSVNTAEAQTEISQGRSMPPDLRAGIELVDVDFAYGDTPVLTGASLTIAAGKFTAVIGPSGAGKTTIADLLLGLYTPDRGAVLIDGVPLTEIDMGAWRSRIGYVPQEMLLFHDSIRRNVTLGDESIGDEDVVEGAAGRRGVAVRAGPRPGDRYGDRRARGASFRRAAAADRHRQGAGGPAEPPRPRRGHDRPGPEYGGGHLRNATRAGRRCHGPVHLAPTGHAPRRRRGVQGGSWVGDRAAERQRRDPHGCPGPTLETNAPGAPAQQSVAIARPLQRARRREILQPSRRPHSS